MPPPGTGLGTSTKPSVDVLKAFCSCGDNGAGTVPGAGPSRITPVCGSTYTFQPELPLGVGSGFPAGDWATLVSAPVCVCPSGTATKQAATPNRLVSSPRVTCFPFLAFMDPPSRVGYGSTDDCSKLFRLVGRANKRARQAIAAIVAAPAPSAQIAA